MSCNIMMHHLCTIWLNKSEAKKTYVSTCTGYVAFKLPETKNGEFRPIWSSSKWIYYQATMWHDSNNHEVPRFFASKHQVIWSILNDLPTVIYSFKLLTSLSKERLFHAYMIDLLKIPPWKLQQDNLTQKNDFKAQIRNWTCCLCRGGSNIRTHLGKNDNNSNHNPKPRGSFAHVDRRCAAKAKPTWKWCSVAKHLDLEMDVSSKLSKVE